MRKPHIYWDEGVTLVSSCTPCSPGCERCWAIAIERRFKPEFKGQVQFHSDRLARFNKKKPAVFSLWNDLFHENISDIDQCGVYKAMILNKQHTYLILTKRPALMANFLSPDNCFAKPEFSHVWHGLTICNQQEANEKIPIFSQIPGKKFLSFEPILERLNVTDYLNGCPEQVDDDEWRQTCEPPQQIILGCETGTRARPMDLLWARIIAEQCKAANVPLFIKALTINGKPNHNTDDWPVELRTRELAW